MYRHKPAGRPSRPQDWITGPDPFVHDQYYVFLQQRNQARYRKEGWPDEFTFEQWKKIWDDSGRYNERGRKPENYCMTRTDITLPWSQDNVFIISRKAHFQEQQRTNSFNRWKNVVRSVDEQLEFEKRREYARRHKEKKNGV